MDLVDVARAVAKRWWLMVIIVGTGAVIAFVLASSVEPTYEVRADTLFVGPAEFEDDVAATTQPSDDEGSLDNPYLRFSGSLEVTSEAVARSVDGNEFRTQLAAEGYEGTFTLEGASSAPLLTVIAEADTPDDALALAERVSTGFEEELVDLQDEANVAEKQQIVTRTLTTSSVTELAGDKNRVLLSVLAISVVIAVGVAVFLESMDARRRARREASADQEFGELDDLVVEEDEEDEHTAPPPIHLGDRTGRSEPVIREAEAHDGRPSPRPLAAWPDGGAE